MRTGRRALKNLSPQGLRAFLEPQGARGPLVRRIEIRESIALTDFCLKCGDLLHAPQEIDCLA